MTCLLTCLASKPAAAQTAVAVAEDSANNTWLLWNNPDHSISLWKTSNATGALVANYSYGPYSGYTATALAIGPDNHVHVLWNYQSGSIALWDLVPGAAPGATSYGPYSGYTAAALTVSPDNHIHVLWNVQGGGIALWDLVTGASPIGYAYAPPTGYTATALASGPDNHLHVLWNNASGNITLWDVLLGSTPVSNAYGPYAGYTALALSVGSDDHVHVLWNHSPDNQIALWDVNLSGVPTGTPYGPYAGYIAKALSVSADNRTHVVWNSVPGQISLWSVNPSGAYTFVNYPSASGLTLSAASVPGGTPVTGTVTLNALAGPGGAAIALSSSTPSAATVPSSVTVPAGQTSVTFTVSTASVSAATSSTIMATAGGMSKTAMLTVNPPASTPLYLSNLTINSTGVSGGVGATGMVTLSGPAPNGGISIALNSNSSAVSTPSSVVVPAGAFNQTFNITTSNVSSLIYATLTAKRNNWTQAVILPVLPTNQSYAIQNLIAAAGNHCVVLNWSDLPPGSNQGYKIYRNGTLLTPTSQEAAMFADNNVANGTNYQYAVSVVNNQGQEINLSSTVSATPTSSLITLGWINAPTITVSGNLVLYATQSSGVNADNYVCLVDGKEVGHGGQQPNDGSGAPGQIIVSLDTTAFLNGTHTVQLISELGDLPAATPPLNLQTNNTISNKSLSGLVDLNSGEVFSMDGILPSITATWIVSLTDDNTGASIQSWQGSGTVVHLSWDGTGNTGNFYYTAHVTAKDGSGNIVASGVNTPLGANANQDTSGADFPAHTYFGVIHGLALVDYISPNLAHDVALETTIKNAFNQMHSNDGSFTGLVLDPTAAGSTHQQKYATYKKIQVLMNLDLYDFYLYGHGQARLAANSPKQQIARWVTANYYPFVPADPTQYNLIHADPVTNTVVANIVLTPYNFVFIDTCYSAGGQSTGVNETNPGEPVLTDWQTAFQCDAYFNLYGQGGTFFGWNGWCVLNTNGGDLSQSLWLYWRETFWTNASMAGTTVEQAATKATQQTQLEIQAGNLKNTYIKPWDSVGSYYRSYRSANTTLTTLPE